MRIAMCLAAAGLALAACDKNSGGVYACRTDADCTGANGGAVCIESRCLTPPQCGSGLTACGASCVDLQRDATHCGACGTSCPGPGAVCRAGACAVSAPVTPAVVLDSPALTAAASATLHVSSCAVLSSIIVTEASAAPAAADPAWAPCTTAPLSVALAVEGANDFSVWGKNPEGVISAAPAAVKVVRDTTPPQVSLSGISDGQSLGADGAPLVSLALTDGASIALAAVESSLDGKLWSELAAVSNVQSGTQPLAVPLPGDATALQLRVRALDGLGNEGTTPVGIVKLLDCDSQGAPFGGGQGIAGHPFRICTLAQLSAAAAASESEYRLHADLDLSSAAGLHFESKKNGSFDGNGHTLSGISLSDPAQPAGSSALGQPVGFFRLLALDASGASGTAAVRNLSLVVQAVDAPDHQAVGALVGEMGAGATVDNCRVTVSGHVAGSLRVGGIAGQVDAGATLSNSSSGGTGAVSCLGTAVAGAFAGNVGGVAGIVFGTASNLSASGLSVSCSATGSKNAGGVIGILRENASATGLSASGVSVSGQFALGGAIGAVVGSAAHLAVSGATVTCANQAYANAGGVAGIVRGGGQVSFASAAQSTVHCEGMRIAGGIAGNVNSGAALSDSSGQGNQVFALGNAGGAVGVLDRAALTRVYAKGRSRVVSVAPSGGNLGGLVGLVRSGAISQAGSDSVIEGDGAGNAYFVAGGAIGDLGALPDTPSTISSVYSRPVWQLANVTSGHVGGVAGLIEPAVDPATLAQLPGGSVTVSDVYVDAEMPALGGAQPGLNGGIVGAIDTGVTATVRRAFAYGSGQADACVLGAFSPAGSTPPVFTGVYFNSDRCVQGTATPAAALSASLTQAQMADATRFAGFGFGSAGPWASAAPHPRLAFETPEAIDAPPSASWTPPAQLGAGGQYQISPQLLSADGAAAAYVEVSYDGGRTWTQVGVADPLPEGTAPLSYSLSQVAGAALVRLRLVSFSGATTVLPPSALSVLDCDDQAAPFGGGQGVAGNPFRICTAAQLAAVAGNIDAEFQLRKDIDLKGQGVQLGYKVNGAFDGDGHAISGFSLALDPLPAGSTQLLRGVGLFQVLGADQSWATCSQTPCQGNSGNASVRNLTLVVGAIDAPDRSRVAAVAGVLGGSGSIDDVHVTVTDHIAAVNAIGGLAGRVVGAAPLISNSSVTGPGLIECQTSLLDSSGTAGGLVGNLDGSLVNALAQNINVACNKGAPVGGAVGNVNPTGVVSTLTVQGVSVTGPVALGGAAGAVAGSVAHAYVRDAQISCTQSPQGFANAGGAIGDLGGSASFVRVSSTSLQCPNSATAGGVAGYLHDGAQLSDAADVGNQIAVADQGGGVAGAVDSSSLVRAYSLGRTRIFSNNNMGGVVGWAHGATLQNVGTDAVLAGSGNSVGAGGLVGVMLSSQGFANSISRSYAHAVFEMTNLGGQSGEAGLVTGVFPDADQNGNPLPGGSVNISDVYTDEEVLAGPPFSGGFFAYVDTRVALSVNHAFAYGSGAPDTCLLPSWGPGTIAPGMTGVYFNSDRCNRGSSAAEAIFGSPLSQLQMADPTKFAGYDFTAVWSAGLAHPQIAPEQSDLTDAPPAAQWTAPTRLGAAGQYSTAPQLTSSGGVAQVFVDISLDGGRTWITVGVAGPFAGGGAPFNINYALPDVAGPALIRLRLLGDNGNVTVLPPSSVVIPECDDQAKGSFGGGIGSADNPYRICTEGQLQLVSSAFNLNYRLYADLDLSKVPPFTFSYFTDGSFDGNGHSIIHLNIQPGSQGDTGFFSAIGHFNGPQPGNPTVKNLTLQVDAVNVPGASNVGALAGHLFADAVVDNVHVLLSGQVRALQNAGGLIGLMQAGTVTSSSVALGPQPKQAGVVADPGTTGQPGGGFGGAFGSMGGSASGISVSGIGVGGANAFGSIGGIAGSVTGALSASSASQVVVTGQSGAGGAVGNLSSSAVASGLLVEDSQISVTGDSAGGLVGALTPSPLLLALTNSEARRVSVSGVQNVGGAVGALDTHQLDGVIVSGQGVLSGKAHVGGVIGSASSGNLSLTRSGSDALITGAPQPAAGLVGSYYPSNGGTATISRCYSRATITGTDLANGGRAGGFFGDLNNITGAAAVSISDSYAVVSLPQAAGALTGGIFGGVNNPNSLALSLHNVFAIAQQPVNRCLTGGASNPLPAGTGIFWDGDLCAITSSNASAGGSGITGSAFAIKNTFPSYDFTPATGVWAMGPDHPVLAFEPPPPASPALSANWNAPLKLGAGAAYSPTVQVTSAGGVAEAFIEMSLDNQQTWTVLGSAGPLPLGTALVPIVVPDVAPASGFLRLRLAGSDGQVAVVQPIAAFQLVLCDDGASPFGGGRGVAESPYRICSQPQLAAVVGHTNTGLDFILESNIDLKDQPLTLGYFVSGTFDGNGFSVQHLSLSYSDSNYDAGLFAGVGHNNNWSPPFPPGNPTVKNLTVQVDGVSAPNRYSVAGLVAHVDQDGVVDNCQAQIDGLVQGKGAVGGLTGVIAPGGTVRNSHAVVSASGTIEAASDAGALAGVLSPHAELSNSSVSGSGKVICDGTVDGEVGGAVGQIGYDDVVATISVDGLTVACPTGQAGGLSGPINSTSVSALSVNNVIVSGKHDVGGVAVALGGPARALAATNSTVTSTGDQSAAGSNNGCGGIAASANVSVSGATVTSLQINCPKAANVGGVIGIMTPVQDTLSSATVVGTKVAGCNATAGLVGSLNGGAVQAVTIDATSSVTLGANCSGMGGIVGWFNGGTVQMAGSSAQLKAGSGGNVGGLVGWMHLTNPGLSTALVSGSYARGSFTVSGTSAVGGLVGSINGADLSAGVTIEDSYTDQDLSPIDPAQTAGIVTGDGTPGPIVLSNVFAFGKAPAGDCTATLNSNVSVRGVFWNSSGCTGNASTAGLAQTGSWTSTASFPTFVFPGTYLNPWVMGAVHPNLSWE